MQYLAIFFTFLAILTKAETSWQQPNILFILVDDLGIGDLGCYGNKTIKTPNIDSLCTNGVKFAHALAAAPICTPSRAAILTGRYPVRLGLEPRGANEARVIKYTTSKGGLPSNETTFAEVLKQNGYTNGFFGKWHLGLHCDVKTTCKENPSNNHLSQCSDVNFCHHPLKRGFDYYYGMPLTNLMECGNLPLHGLQGEMSNIENVVNFYRYVGSLLVYVVSYFFFKPFRRSVFMLLLLVALSWYGYHLFYHYLTRQFNCVVMRNDQVVEQTVNLESITANLVNETKTFINKNKEKRFMAYVSYHKMHAALATAQRFVGRSRHGSYGDSMVELDWSVGEILKEIHSLNLTDRTLVIFTSDHGPATNLYNLIDGERQGGWPGIYRGGKATNFEGGLRVPLMLKWPGKLREGLVIDRPVSLLDIFPTILSLVKVSSADPRNLVNDLDGKDISKLLFGRKDYVNRIFFHYCGSNIHAVTLEEKEQKKVWKIHFIIHKDPSNPFRCYGESVLKLRKPLIYDLVSGPSEDAPLLASDPDFERVWHLAASKAFEFNSTVDFNVSNQLSKEMNTFSLDKALCCGDFPHCFC